MILLSSLLLSGCGYHVDNDDALSSFPTISVPYFKGDSDGILTDSVIKGLATSGEFNYVSKGGSVILEGVVLSDTSEHIGYQYDRDPLS
ncbi:MAG: LptE family protein, partial [Chlamydiia bacterium]|nr:LptE family protein [Chlamydiia bacterium]